MDTREVGNSEWLQADWSGRDGAQLPTREWIRCIIKLTAAYENVYADVSGLNIDDVKIWGGLLEMLKLIQTNDKFKHLRYKLIFGSGWQGGTQHNYSDYCNKFKELFYEADETGKLWEHASLFNAWNFYGLSKEKFNNILNALPNSKNSKDCSSTLMLLSG